MAFSFNIYNFSIATTKHGIFILIPPYIRMLSSGWLMKGVFFFYQFFVFSAFPPLPGYLPKISRYYRKISHSRRNPFFKQFMKSRMLFELLGFLLSTNAKVKKMTTVSAVMFEIVEMYTFQIHLHYIFLACCMLKQNRDLFYF